MKAGFAWLVWLAGCGFHGPSAGAGDGGVSDGSGGGPDAPPDTMAMRTRVGLVGLWEFNDADGTTIADTSDATPKVPLVVTRGTVAFANGTMTPVGISVIASAARPHLNVDAQTSGAVTLEAWVSPVSGQQGQSGAPAVVAGLDGNLTPRNISLLQVDKRWVGRVRTTPDLTGGPDLPSTTDITAGAMVHLAVVADASQRILYVNGQPDAVDAAPSPLYMWDQSYAMVLGNETPAGNRQWSGTFALVAVYARALSAYEIQTNYAAGPDAR